MRIKATVIIVA